MFRDSIKYHRPWDNVRDFVRYEWDKFDPRIHLRA